MDRLAADRLAADRLTALQEILQLKPDDSFARYGLAMEYSSRGEVESALAEFDRLLAQNPDYTAAYFMAAQTLARAGRTDEAGQRLRQGIAAAVRAGNSHAEAEMQEMLDRLEG